MHLVPLSHLIDISNHPTVIRHKLYCDKHRPTTITYSLFTDLTYYCAAECFSTISSGQLAKWLPCKLISGNLAVATSTLKETSTNNSSPPDKVAHHLITEQLPVHTDGSAQTDCSQLATQRLNLCTCLAPSKCSYYITCSLFVHVANCCSEKAPQCNLRAPISKCSPAQTPIALACLMSCPQQ